MNLMEIKILFKYLESISISRLCEQFSSNGQIWAIFEVEKNFELLKYELSITYDFAACDTEISNM